MTLRVFPQRLRVWHFNPHEREARDLLYIPFSW